MVYVDISLDSKVFLVDGVVLLFMLQILFYFLIERKSKLQRGSSREPFVKALREYVGCFGSDPDKILCAVDSLPLVDTSLPERPSVNSPEELGLVLLAMTTLFEELPL